MNMNNFKSSLLLALPLALYAADSSETKPLPCGAPGVFDTIQGCSFEGEFCSYVENFDNVLRATDFFIYEGDPLRHELVVESGKPVIENGVLKMPLLQTANPEQGLATIVSTTRFLNFGSVEARLKTIGVSSVVTTLIGISNVLDEIDFEWTPKNAQYATDVQANWYWEGDPTYNANFMNTHTDTPTFEQFHTYRFDWTPEKIDWSVDGVLFHTQTKAELGVNASRFPDTPMRVSFGVWQAVNNDWAGQNQVNWNGNQKLEVEVDYIKVFGTECGGGTLAADPPLSAGFASNRLESSANWTPETSSSFGNGGGSGNIFGQGKTSPAAAAAPVSVAGLLISLLLLLA